MNAQTVKKTMFDAAKIVIIGAIIKKIVKFKKGDYVLDIASNDATLLKSYKLPGVNYVGIDPTISRYKKFYLKNFIENLYFFLRKPFPNIGIT